MREREKLTRDFAARLLGLFEAKDLESALAFFAGETAFRSTQTSIPALMEPVEVPVRTRRGQLDIPGDGASLGPEDESRHLVHAQSLPFRFTACLGTGPG